MLKAKFEVTTAEQTKQIAEQTKTISADQNINKFLLIHKKISLNKIIQKFIFQCQSITRLKIKLGVLHLYYTNYRRKYTSQVQLVANIYGVYLEVI